MLDPAPGARDQCSAVWQVSATPDGVYAQAVQDPSGACGMKEERSDRKETDSTALAARRQLYVHILAGFG